MQQEDIDDAKALCLAAKGIHIRVMRVTSRHGLVDRPSHNSGRFGTLDTPRVDFFQSGHGERRQGWSVPWEKSQAMFDRYLDNRGLNAYDWNCACLPHQFTTWWGYADEWREENKLIIWELDVGDLIVLNQQVLVPTPAKRRVIAEFI